MYSCAGRAQTAASKLVSCARLNWKRVIPVCQDEEGLRRGRGGNVPEPILGGLGMKMQLCMLPVRGLKQNEEK